MNNSQIETEATAKFKEAIRRNPFLKPYIDENDKTPVWDGHIYVYSTESTCDSKKNLIGRVPTQIKGHFYEAKFPLTVKYPVSILDMSSYQTEGGVFFVVVYINSKFEAQIYYQQLLSLDLARISLNMQKNGKNTHAEEMRMFPHDNVQAANLFINFLEDKKRQMGTVDVERLYISDWTDNTGIESIKFHVSSVIGSPSNPLRDLSIMPLYLYGKVKSLNIEIPIERVENGIVRTSNIHEIGCNDRVYFTKDSTHTIWERGNLRIEFGKFFSIDVRFDGTVPMTTDFHFDLFGTLNEIIAVSDFLVGVIQTKRITLNQGTLDFTIKDDTIVNNAMNYVDDLLKVRRKLDELHVESDLQLHDIQKHDMFLLDVLLAINENIEVSNIKGKQSITRLSIANIQLTVYIYERDGKTFLKDFFYPDEDIPVVAVTNDEGEKLVSKYMLLHEEGLCSSNLVADRIYLDLIRYDTWSDYHSMVNLFLLDCLRAFDSRQGNSVELLKLSSLLIGWLVSKEPESMIYKMNYWQIVRRTRLLKKDELDEICRICRTPDERWDIRCGAMILAEDYTNAKRLLSEQNKKDCEGFCSYPIYTLMK